MYDIFEFSPKAFAWLSQCESEAVAKRGLQPSATQIKEILFGIVYNKRNEPQLGVKKLILVNQ